MPANTYPMPGCLALNILLFEIGAVLEQALDILRLVVEGSPHQRRHAGLVWLVHISHAAFHLTSNVLMRPISYA